MASSARFAAVSQFDIENHILDYFCNRFHRPPTEINRNTDLKQHFNFTTDGTWASVAAGLSAESWMKALNVEIEQAEMKDHNTAKALASVIWPKTTKLVAVNASQASFNTFSVSVRTPRKAVAKSNVTVQKSKGKKKISKKKKQSR
jgi:hypothetical protein